MCAHAKIRTGRRLQAVLLGGMRMTDPLDDDDFDERTNLTEVNVSDAWLDIMETQAFLRDDPFDWSIESTSRYNNHHLEVYVEDSIDDYNTHEGAIVPTGLLRFMAGRGWYTTRIGMGQSPASDNWIPCIGFSRGPEVFDLLVSTGIPVEPDGYEWPLLSDVIAEAEYDD